MGFNKAFEDKKFMIFYVRKLSKNIKNKKERMNNVSNNILGFISELGNFKEIKGRRNYNYWENYTYEIKNEDILARAKAIEENIKILIPKINHPRYTHLRDLKNSHLSSNRMALELIIRNNEFKDLFMQAEYILDKNLYDVKRSAKLGS